MGKKVTRLQFTEDDLTDKAVRKAADRAEKAADKAEKAEEKATAPAAVEEDATLLFTTATCPNCKIACALLDKAGVIYEKLLANEHADLVQKFGVRQAPTLVVVQNGEVTKHTGVSDIKKYLGN